MTDLLSISHLLDGLHALDALHALGAWSGVHFWLPLLIWTLLAVPAYGMLRRISIPAELRYRLSQALLAALPVGVLATAVFDFSALGNWLSRPEPTASGLALVGESWVVGTAPAAPAAAPTWTLTQGLGLLTVAAALVSIVQLARLTRSAMALRRLHTAARAPADAETQSLAQRLARSMGIRRDIRVRRAARTATPLTYGAARPTILLPADLEGRPDALRMTLTHELVHIRRNDFLARWGEQLTAALFAIHPGVWGLTRLVERAREMACDAEALAASRCSPKDYATLLYRFSAPATRRQAFALSIAETSSSLKERIQAMLQPTAPPSRLTRFAPGLAIGAVLALALSIVACSDAITPPSSSPESEATLQSQPAPSSLENVYVETAERPQLKGGLQAMMDEVTYPETAKAAGIEGRVFVQFVVDKTGAVRDAAVTRGVHKALDAEALRAVRAQQFEPGKNEDGEPVNVKMALPVTFKLDAGSKSSASAPPPPTSIDRQTIVIQLESNGPVLINGRAVPMSEVQSAVSDALQQAGRTPVVSLKVTDDTPTSRVRQVQDQLRAADSPKISYSTESGTSRQALDRPPPPTPSLLETSGLQDYIQSIEVNKSEGQMSRLIVRVTPNTSDQVRTQLEDALRSGLPDSAQLEIE